jgi:hypothetical protein
MDRISEIIHGWRERCAWLELQAEDLEARRKVLTCDGEDVTAIQANNIRRVVAHMREIIAWRDRRSTARSPRPRPSTRPG